MVLLSDFSVSCIWNYTNVLTSIDQYNKTFIKPLAKQLVTLQTQCSQQSIGLLPKQVFLLEKRVEDWISNIMLNLKYLMEMKFKRLNDTSKSHCHRLNEMRLSSKGIFFSVVLSDEQFKQRKNSNLIFDD